MQGPVHALSYLKYSRFQITCPIRKIDRLLGRCQLCETSALWDITAPGRTSTNWESSRKTHKTVTSVEEGHSWPTRDELGQQGQEEEEKKCRIWWMEIAVIGRNKIGVV